MEWRAKAVVCFHNILEKQGTAIFGMAIAATLTNMRIHGCALTQKWFKT